MHSGLLGKCNLQISIHCQNLQAKPLMQLPPRLATADASLAHASQLAGASSSADEDGLFANVHVHLDVQRQGGNESLPAAATANKVYTQHH
jgi:hypothetical protein